MAQQSSLVDMHAFWECMLYIRHRSGAAPKLLSHVLYSLNMCPSARAMASLLPTTIDSRSADTASRRTCAETGRKGCDHKKVFMTQLKLMLACVHRSPQSLSACYNAVSPAGAGNSDGVMHLRDRTSVSSVLSIKTRPPQW